MCRKGFAHDGDEDAVGGGRRRATAQDDGVAGLQAEASGVDGDIGPRLIDHPNHAHRHADLPDLQAIGQRRAADDLAHRVGEGGDIAQGVGDRGDARRGEAEAVLEALRHTPVAPALQVLGVGGNDALGGGVEGVSEGAQDLVLAGTGK